MRKLASVAALWVVVSSSGAARAWDDFGHMQVAAAAYKKLKPKTKARVAALLKLNPRHANWVVGVRKNDETRVAFMRAATWADAIKADRAYKDDEQTSPTASQNAGYTDMFRHKYWHYVDRPFSRDGTPLVDAAAPNAATQLTAFRTTLCAADAPDGLKSYDLVWLLHLVGDLHQPLHCVSRFDRATPLGDRGGNLVQIAGNAQPAICEVPRYCPFDPPGDLHAFLDDITGSSYGANAAETASNGLPKPNAQKAAVMDVEAWVKEGFELAQSAVYVSPIDAGKGPFTLDTAYQNAALALGRERISLAGARLATLLNECLGK